MHSGLPARYTPDSARNTSKMRMTLPASGRGKSTEGRDKTESRDGEDESQWRGGESEMGGVESPPSHLVRVQACSQLPRGFWL